jgi:hypothetical protein
MGLKFRLRVVGAGVGPKRVQRGSRPHQRRKGVDMVEGGCDVDYYLSIESVEGW